MKLNINNFSINSISLLVCIVLFFGGCKKALDLQPLNSYSEKDVWADPKLIQVFVNNIYDQAILAYVDDGFCWGVQTDELYGNFNLSNETAYVRGEATPDNGEPLNHWNKMYGAIRYTNLFFANIGQVSSTADADLIKRMTGEVHFLRAMAYFELLKRFGGVPLIEKVYDVNDKDFNEKRATWTETKDFILSDINEAVEMLPPSYAADVDKGRATVGAALALKSELLLYAASPYFNKSNDKKLWQEARDAAKAVIDFSGYKYTLYGNAADGTYNKTFIDFFNSEVIFSRVYSVLAPAGWYNTVSRDLSPNGYNGYGAFDVLQQLVDDFEMADGSKFSWSNPEQAKNPYDKREPRFYEVVLANNQQFKGRPTEFYEGGADSPQSPYSPWNASKTRYCVKKMVNENLNWDQQPWEATQWVVFRLSEIYLNYAEACSALGEDGEALKYLNKIRTEKAGLSEVNAAGTALMDKIRHERRIELCFEGNRFFDIRRWGIAEVGSEDAKGVIITKKSDGTFSYEIATVQERNWTPSFYYYPIPRSETQKNPALEQNPYYK